MNSVRRPSKPIAVLGALTLGYFSLVAPGCNELPFLGSGGGVAQHLPLSNISGRAVDAQILGGELNVYSYINGGKGRLLSGPHTTSEVDGSYALDLRAEPQPILIEVKGGTYTEEASGVSIELRDTDVLRALAYHEPGKELEVFVTPFTNIAAGLAKHKIANGSPIERAINESKDEISNIVGVDIITTDPKNITDENNASESLDDGIKYGF